MKLSTKAILITFTIIVPVIAAIFYLNEPLNVPRERKPNLKLKLKLKLPSLPPFEQKKKEEDKLEFPKRSPTTVVQKRAPRTTNKKTKTSPTASPTASRDKAAAVILERGRKKRKPSKVSIKTPKQNTDQPSSIESYLNSAAEDALVDKIIAGFPAADECQDIYFDFGSNLGVQVRKWFEPYKYTDAKATWLYEDLFGVGFVHRRRTSCTFGFEISPRHKPRLEHLQTCYKKSNWRAYFLDFAVGAVSGEKLTVYGNPKSRMEDWGANVMGSELVSKNSKRRETGTVDTINIANFIAKMSAKYKPKQIFMKMDIEGAEFTGTLDAMLKANVLCSDVIRSASIEFHANMFKQLDLHEYTDIYGKSVKSFQKVLSTHAEKHCRDGTATSFISLDDESYIHDGKALPENCEPFPV